MQFPVLPVMNPDFWVYKAEGFDSVILSFVGPEDSEFHGKVLRLYKNQEPQFRRGNEPEIEDFTSRVILHQNYIKNFIKPFLDYIDAGTPYAIAPEFVQALSNKIQSNRPPRRINESHICTTSKVCLIHEDHIPTQGISIEIKPKWGFLPDCPLIPSDSIKRRVSRFQLMQRYKFKLGQIKSITSYDPLDLFSGERSSISKAITDITTNPQSNLKVIRDGKTSELTPNERETLVESLYTHDVLSKILKLQRLDKFDVECIVPILEKANSPTWEEMVNDENIINGICKMMNNEFVLPNDVEKVKELIENMSESEARINIAAFLIAQAAKDCSVMISGQGNDVRFDVIDFDLKMPQHIISQYLKLDKKIIDAYKEMENK
ncbi:inositol-pentakisphosphate 2-kinase IPK1-like [Histomonas meleagridis]|uniref:inositol-pentakisphosphate 2-kinase IPK1-like n=1 Tax=Histomonas meleagridis TaxID=135588 RepID=UPI0035598C78|nr:inositol-pentakisphosphate 2-kinase IPK1-like [Histomonas meleagridis]KAH0804982.1 inositol-pentakisphosphate 2-kinase IPK1-like [Histomonas meleagridis]